eukprot:1454695-Amphidinium_carterae.1
MLSCVKSHRQELALALVGCETWVRHGRCRHVRTLDNRQQLRINERMLVIMRSCTMVACVSVLHRRCV